MQLLTSTDYADIYAAMSDLHDTFAVKDIMYEAVTAQASVEMFQEDRLDIVTTTYNFKAVVEYEKSERSDIYEYQSGAIDNRKVRLTVFVRDSLIPLGLWDAVNNVPFMNQTTDYLSIGSERYKVENIQAGGNFETTPVYIYIKAYKNVETQ